MNVFWQTTPTIVAFIESPVVMDFHLNQQHTGIHPTFLQPLQEVTSGQSYKASTIVIYNSRVVPDWKIPPIMTLES